MYQTHSWYIMSQTCNGIHQIPNKADNPSVEPAMPVPNANYINPYALNRLQIHYFLLFYQVVERLRLR